MIPGYDFSSKDNIDVIALQEGTGFVIHRVIRQNGLKDPLFQSRYHALRDHRPEIVRFSYLFLNWFKHGSDQAQAVLDVGINFTEPGTGPIAIDLEADSGSDIEKYIMQNRADCIKIVNDCIAHFRGSPAYRRQDIIIYSNNGFLRNVIAHTWPDCLYWMASYQETLPAHPAQPAIMWQYSQYGKLDRTVTDFTTKTGSVDLDYFMGTPEQLNKLANLTT
jgi:GH25 family lysozyme M1 (1,4-beta-N-acetylmuramidase)